MCTMYNSNAAPWHKASWNHGTQILSKVGGVKLTWVGCYAAPSLAWNIQRVQGAVSVKTLGEHSKKSTISNTNLLRHRGMS